MKKLLLLPFIIIAVAICFRNSDSIHANPRIFRPGPPTTVITPPKNSAESFQVQIPANGNTVFVSFSSIATPANGGNPQVWINGSFTYITNNSRYRIASSYSDQTVSIQVKYNSPTQLFFDGESAAGSNASYISTYSNNAPNMDRATLTICDSVLCP